MCSVLGDVFGLLIFSLEGRKYSDRKKMIKGKIVSAACVYMFLYIFSHAYVHFKENVDVYSHIIHKMVFWKIVKMQSNLNSILKPFQRVMHIHPEY